MAQMQNKKLEVGRLWIEDKRQVIEVRSSKQVGIRMTEVGEHIDFYF